MTIQKDSQCKIREMFILQWRRSFFHNFATKEVPPSRWLVVVTMLVVDNRGNDTHGLQLAGNLHRFRVCLVGWMEKKELKIGEKMSGKGVWLRRGGEQKSGGAHKFSLLPLQNTISPNWRENQSKKWEKYLDKTAPTALNILGFFFFSFDFSFLQ